MTYNPEKYWHDNNCNPIADIKSMKELIANQTGYVPIVPLPQAYEKTLKKLFLEYVASRSTLTTKMGRFFRRLINWRKYNGI